MIYIFDSCSFRVLDNYFPESFPTFWEKFNLAVKDGKIISVREVLNELESRGISEQLREWIKSHKEIFLLPDEAEQKFVGEIFKIDHFKGLVGIRQQLEGRPVADPFVIASAKVKKGCVVTEESQDKPNAPNIPNVCRHFGIECTNLEGFLQREGWSF